MKTGITKISMIPVRASNSERSEQVTQLLFGEYFEVLQTRGNWLRIKSLADNYEGWIDRIMAGTISDSEPYLSEKHEVIQKLYTTIYNNNNEPITISAGCCIPQSNEDGIFNLGEDSYTLSNTEQTAEDITNSALKFINSPYLWGGKTPMGIDCSGLTQLVFRMNGIDLPRDASQQVNFGETICFISDAQAGDVAYFKNKDNKIIHTGILLDNNHIIHASGKVRIDKIDHSGIYNSELKRYTHILSVIKRISK